MQTILIAGATSMIGRACTKILDKEMNTLILLGQNASSLEELSKNIQTKNAIYVCDLSCSDQVKETIESVEKAHGTVGAFIHNVAIYPWKKIADLSQNDWEKTMRVNLGSAFSLTQALIPAFKKNRSGRIVYISSIAGEIMGLENMSVYSTSKAGLNGFMRTCALELAPFKVTVNAISPGKVYDQKTLTKKQIDEKLQNIPLKRFQDPLDIAYMAEFLISEKAQNITGQNFIIDGGQSIG